jgi:hypothetical protein
MAEVVPLSERGNDNLIKWCTLTQFKAIRLFKCLKIAKSELQASTEEKKIIKMWTQTWKRRK